MRLLLPPSRTTRDGGPPSAASTRGPLSAPSPRRPMSGAFARGPLSETSPRGPLSEAPTGGSLSEAAGRVEGRALPIDHYTGTLYKALAPSAWSAAERRWALAHLLLHDKDVGVVAAGSWDPLDLASLDGTLLIDARSKEYVRLIRPPDTAFGLRVVSEGDDGRRLAISHWNKHYKGVLARALVRDRPRIGGVGSLLSWAESAGVRLERVGDRELDLVV